MSTEYARILFCFEKNQNTPRPSEHSPVRKKNVATFMNRSVMPFILDVRPPLSLGISYVDAPPRSHMRKATHEFLSAFFLRCGGGGGASLKFYREKDSTVPFPRRQ